MVKIKLVKLMAGIYFPSLSPIIMMANLTDPLTQVYWGDQTSKKKFCIND